MRSLIYYVAVTLDGRIAGPNGEFDFFPFDERYAQQTGEEWADGLPTHLLKAFGLTAGHTKWDTVVMGRGTYQPGLDAGITDPYAHLRTVVYSKSLAQSDYPAVEVVAEDPVEHVRALKAEDGGDIWLCGGSALAQTLAAEIDRLALKIYPVTVGDGIPLFAGSFAPQQWKLTNHRVFDLGVIVAEYDRG